MGKVSKFGIFSPAVVAAKIALGEGRLNKIRGKVGTITSYLVGFSRVGLLVMANRLDSRRRRSTTDQICTVSS